MLYSIIFFFYPYLLSFYMLIYWLTFIVLVQLEGPLSPAELVEILQRTLEEQGLAFGSARAKQEEKIRADRRLREEQDAAYLASLQIDKVCASPLSTLHILTANLSSF